MQSTGKYGGYQFTARVDENTRLLTVSRKGWIRHSEAELTLTDSMLGSFRAFLDTEQYDKELHKLEVLSWKLMGYQANARVPLPPFDPIAFKHTHGLLGLSQTRAWEATPHFSAFHVTRRGDDFIACYVGTTTSATGSIEGRDPSHFVIPFVMIPEIIDAVS